MAGFYVITEDSDQTAQSHMSEGPFSRELRSVALLLTVKIMGVPLNILTSFNILMRSWKVII